MRWNEMRPLPGVRYDTPPKIPTSILISGILIWYSKTCLITTFGYVIESPEARPNGLLKHITKFSSGMFSHANWRDSIFLAPIWLNYCSCCQKGVTGGQNQERQPFSKVDKSGSPSLLHNS